MRVTWHPVDREVAEKEKGSARAEVLIILGVEGLAPCRHPSDSLRHAKQQVLVPTRLASPDASRKCVTFVSFG